MTDEIGRRERGYSAPFARPLRRMVTDGTFDASSLGQAIANLDAQAWPLPLAD